MSAGLPLVAVGGFESLGFLSGGPDNSRATDVSADGSVVVGVASDFSGKQAFRWTAGEGMVALGHLPGGVSDTYAYAVSGDGLVVVGGSESANGPEAFRWTEAGGMVGIGDFDGGNFASVATDVSADGSVMVGNGSKAGIAEGFRWTAATGMVGIGDLPGGVFQSSAEAVSPDGAIIAGQSFITQATEAIRWTGGSMMGLGQLAGGLNAGVGLDLTPDGSVVVGWAGIEPLGAQGAFRWTEATGMVGLGPLEESSRYSIANAVSADGSVIVGEADSPFSLLGVEAFIWDEAGGMRTLAHELEEVYGHDLSGWSLRTATGISEDGKVVVGTGYSDMAQAEVAFRATLEPAPQPTLVTYRWSGPLKIKRTSSSLATYNRVQIGEIMGGIFTIGMDDFGSTFVPPATHEFPGEGFFGTITGHGTTISTELSTRPLEVRFLDNHLPNPDELALLESCLGTTLPEGTRVDMAEIEVDLSFSIKRLEFGVSLVSLDLDWISGPEYREFPSLDEADLGLYFVVEERLGTETFNAIGVLDAFAVEVLDPIIITDVRRVGGDVLIAFDSTPGFSLWRVEGDPALDGGFPQDLTGLPGTSVVEDAGNPGSYTATVRVAGRGPEYFLRIAR